MAFCGINWAPQWWHHRLVKNRSEPMNEARMPSERLAALLNLAKDPARRHYTTEAVASALEWCYASGMTLGHVMHHLAAAFEEAVREPRFELGSDAIEGLLMAPVRGHTSIDLYGPPNLQTAYSVEQFYGAMIQYVLGRFLTARIDWCREALNSEMASAKAWRERAAARERATSEPAAIN